MGLSISYPQDESLPEDDKDGTDRLYVRSLSFDNLSTLETLESPPALLDTLTSKRLIVRGCLSFEKREGDPLQVETTLSMVSPKPAKKRYNYKPIILPRYRSMENLPPNSPVIGMVSPAHQAAALRMQKVYKSFRTRRQLADCAVLVEQRWWKLLDFALLKRNSVSFFDVQKPESALSRWSRARVRAAKVGKGLSKDEKAQKLALQHWLEAIDPRHRYGHNLNYYYQYWLHCESKQPFFYWLDIGEGKELSIDEHCPRSKLLQQCIRYLGPKERVSYEVVVEDGKMMYRLSNKIVDTSEGPKDTKWIFVLSTTRVLYIGTKSKGTFQHSSFLAGGATSAAGRLIVENGILKAVWPHSGHYCPTEANFREFMNYLKSRNVDLTNVKLSPGEGEEDEWFREKDSLSQLEHTESSDPASEEGSSNSFKKEDSSTSHDKTTTSTAKATGAGAGADKDNKATAKATPGTPSSTSHDKTATSTATSGTPTMKRSSSGSRLQRKRPPRLVVSKNRLGNGGGEQGAGAFGDCLDFCKENLFRGGEGEGEGDGEGEGGEELVAVPQEKILHRINSKMSLHSYQLGNQLSFRWTTGAGPRIGCVRDYPPELQFRSLEQVCLSPRGGAGPSRLDTSPRQSPCASLVPSTPGGLVSPLYAHAGAGTPAPRLQHGAA